MATALGPALELLKRALNPTKPSMPNTGLLFDRYLPIWEQDGPDGFRRLEKSPLQDALNAFADRHNQTPGARNAELRLVLDRWKRLEQTAQGRQSLIGQSYELESPLALGMGGDHPLENSLTFDASSGLPALPGSAIKGMCRAQAEALELFPARREALFGPDEVTDEESGACGDLIFYPALPETWPELTLELLNPHYKTYYEKEGKRDRPQPVGTESPVPIFFVSVQPGVRYRFYLRSRSGDRQNLEVGAELLRLGLELQGLGSKTEVGMGRFKSLEESRWKPRASSAGKASAPAPAADLLPVPALVLEAMIGNFPGRIQSRELRAALAPREPGEEFRLSLLRDQAPEDPVAYQLGSREQLDVLIRRARSRLNVIEHEGLHVFAFAPIPMLMLLGHLLGDTEAIEVHQRFRSSNDWKWREEPSPLSFEVEQEPLEADTRHVGVLFSVSGEVNRTAALAALRAQVGNESVALVTLRSSERGLEVVQSPAHVEAFRGALNSLLEPLRGQALELHYFPALPVSLAVATGQVHRQADPVKHVYDWQTAQGTFVRVLTLNPRG